MISKETLEMLDSSLRESYKDSRNDLAIFVFKIFTQNISKLSQRQLEDIQVLIDKELEKKWK